MWTSQTVLLGKHFSREHELAFASMGVNYPNLEEWVGEPPFRFPDHKMEGKKLVGYESVYIARDPIEVEVPTLEATLKIECAPRFIHEFRSRTQEYAEFVSIYPKGQRNLDWYLASYKDFANLLTLLIGHPVYPNRIVGYSLEENEGGETDQKDVYVFLHHKKRLTSKLKHPAEMLVALPWIKTWFREAVQKWFEKAVPLRDVYNLFFGSLKRRQRFQSRRM